MMITNTARIASSIPIQLRSWLAPGEGTAAEGCGAPVPCNKVDRVK